MTYTKKSGGRFRFISCPRNFTFYKNGKRLEDVVLPKGVHVDIEIVYNPNLGGYHSTLKIDRKLAQWKGNILDENHPLKLIVERID